MAQEAGLRFKAGHVQSWRIKSTKLDIHSNPSSESSSQRICLKNVLFPWDFSWFPGDSTTWPFLGAQLRQCSLVAYQRQTWLPAGTEALGDAHVRVTDVLDLQVYAPVSKFVSGKLVLVIRAYRVIGRGFRLKIRNNITGSLFLSTSAHVEENTIIGLWDSCYLRHLQIALTVNTSPHHPVVYQWVSWKNRDMMPKCQLLVKRVCFWLGKIKHLH